ncbi:MAG: MFS transporter [Mycobacterium leprae]
MEQERVPWQRNLWLVWIALFVVNVGFSLIMPFLPLYIQSMGLTGPHVELWTGLIFSANFITAAFFLPYWGGVADRFGRRLMMIRAGVGMSIVISLMGFTHAPWQMLVLRLLQGTTVGFLPASIAYMTSIVPKDRTGYTLGILQTAITGGTILGPFVGGVLATAMGYRPIFFLNGFACLLAAAIAFVFLKEDVKPVARQEKKRPMSEDFRMVAANPTLLAMMVVVMVQQFSVMNAEPIIPLFLQTLAAPASVLSFLSGTIFSVVGVADVLASPFLGRRGDRYGYKKVLMICLGGVAISYFLQGLSITWWHLLITRFLQGCFVGGIMASANSLISLTADAKDQGRTFGVSSSFQQVGNFLGPLAGSAIAAGYSYRAVFPFTAVLILANLVWVWRLVPERRGVDEVQPNPAAMDPEPGLSD